MVGCVQIMASSGNAVRTYQASPGPFGLGRASNRACCAAKTRTHTCCSVNVPLLRCTTCACRCCCYARLLIWLLLSRLFARFLLVVCFSLLSFVTFLFLLFSVLLFSLFLLLSFLRWEKPKVTRLAHSRLELVLCQSC